MVKPIYLYLLLVTVVVLMMESCANIKPPTGGPEDTAAPKLKKSYPENNSLNYKGRTILLEFDEYVDGQKINENIVISPLVESKYEIITKKKTVMIRFNEPFKENTTYNINLGESVKDVTKGNFVKNMNLAFSTGPYIDSLSIKGFTYDFIKGNGLKDLSILVYNSNDTNTVKNSKPLYFSRTDPQGNFVINNVKEGTYNIYALNDLNKNFKYDNEKEDIAYLHQVVVDKPVENLRFGITRIDKTGPEIISYKQEYEYYLLSMNEGIEEYHLRSDNTPVISDLSEDSKTIRIFNNFNTKDSISLYTHFTDSSGNISSDTVKILFEEYKDKNKKNTFSVQAFPKNLEITSNESIRINFNKPVEKINYPQISLKQDSTLISLEPEEFTLDSTLLNIRFINKYTFSDSLTLFLEKGAFMNINGDSSQEAKFKFIPKNEEKYGILSGTVICQEPYYIFQLLNGKGKIVDSKKNATKFEYKMLEPGEYQLKVIIDVNNNGRWDATDLDNEIPPEPIHYYKEKINLRANWELLDIKFEVK